MNTMILLGYWCVATNLVKKFSAFFVFDIRIIRALNSVGLKFLWGFKIQEKVEYQNKQFSLKKNIALQEAITLQVSKIILLS